MTRIHDVTHQAIRERMDKRKCTVKETQASKGLQKRMQDLYFELLPANGGNKDKAKETKTPEIPQSPS